MRDALKYLLLLVVTLALQMLLFEPMNLGPYLYPLVYIAFIVLLPMKSLPIVVLLSGAAVGAFMDIFTGTPGIHSIATLFTAYTRQYMLNFIVGKEYVGDGGVPSAKSIGAAKFMRYASFVVFTQCIIFFSLEAMNWRYFYLVLLKIALSGAFTLFFVWLISLLFTVKSRKKV